MRIRRRTIPYDYIIRLKKQGMGLADIGRKTGVHRTTIMRTIKSYEAELTQRMINGENLEKIRETILGDKKPEDLIELSRASVEVKINIVEQLTQINESLMNELRKVEKELRTRKPPPDSDLKKELRNQKVKIASEIRAQQKFGVEIAGFVKEIDFRKIVMEEINQEAPDVAERIYARLRSKL